MNLEHQFLCGHARLLCCLLGSVEAGDAMLLQDFQVETFTSLLDFTEQLHTKASGSTWD